MLLDLINGRMNFTTAVTYIVAALMVIFLTQPFHEYAHAKVADMLGDKTARFSGRLTVNPFAHIDYFGALGIILFGFGWAKPVPINPRNFRNPKKGMVLTAIAGPLMNIALAFAACFIFYGVDAFAPGKYDLFKIFIVYYIDINVGLAVFNLIPIPPLDGWKILSAVLPSKIYWKLLNYERYYSFILILLIATGILSVPLSYLRAIVINLIALIPSIIF